MDATQLYGFVIVLVIVGYFFGKLMYDKPTQKSEHN
ncbi:hypothetical protein AR543_p0095 (plasmid) [Paenibacillus bovis]|uniref:Uncharacterized protein n=1 Tax=Paenibacillus bovis TaxID=1616788 RepID=A0A1X9T446_9BACL|nr:hypothetical protein AR543_p0095 [Paenibacillus bovis]